MTVSPALENANFTTKAVVCSILPREDGQDHTVVNRTHGVYFIYHPHDGEEYKLSDVTWKRDYADVGDYDPAYTRRSGIERRKEFTFDARQIANDICKQINSNGPGDASYFGVFVCAGDSPTRQELDQAHKQLENYFMQCIAAADSQWSNNPKHDLISGVAKRGARYLKVEREWLSTYTQMDECPACGTRIRPGVAVCKACGAILNEEKAVKYGLLSKEYEIQPVKEAKTKKVHQAEE